MRALNMLAACLLAAILAMPALPTLATDWNPDSVAKALLSVQLPADDLSWQGPMEDDTADAFDGAVRQVQVFSFDSLTVFSVYPTEEDAQLRIIGDYCYPIDQKIDDAGGFHRRVDQKRS